MGVFAHCIGQKVGYTYNETPSEPLGFYLLYHAEIKPGNIYEVCLNSDKKKYLAIMIRLGLPASTRCGNNHVALLKTVVAASGDEVEITKAGVAVNHKILPHSKGIYIYKNINLAPLPIGFKHILLSGESWLYGNLLNSYDSRYFGVVNTTEVINKAILVMPINLTTL